MWEGDEFKAKMGNLRPQKHLVPFAQVMGVKLHSTSEKRFYLLQYPKIMQGTEDDRRVRDPDKSSI